MTLGTSCAGHIQSDHKGMTLQITLGICDPLVDDLENEHDFY